MSPSLRTPETRRPITCYINLSKRAVLRPSTRLGPLLLMLFSYNFPPGSPCSSYCSFPSSLPFTISFFFFPPFHTCHFSAPQTSGRQWWALLSQPDRLFGNQVFMVAPSRPAQIACITNWMFLAQTCTSTKPLIHWNRWGTLPRLVGSRINRIEAGKQEEEKEEEEEEGKKRKRRKRKKKSWCW